MRSTIGLSYGLNLEITITSQTVKANDYSLIFSITNFHITQSFFEVQIMFNDILLICIGNICRSPTGEYLFKHKLSEKPNIRVHSAGVGALVDHGIDEMAGQILLDNGIDARAHRARQLSTKMLVEADLILTMDNSLIKNIIHLAPQASGKTFLLSKWSNGAAVGDPYRKSREAFEHVFDKIDAYTSDWVKYL